MKVCVTGGRDYSDKATVFRVLNELHAATPIWMVIHGDATGADSLADSWARQNEIIRVCVPAKWKTGTRGLAEGPARNRRMILEFEPDLLVAFPGGKGTKDCAAYAEHEGIEVKYVAVA